MVRYSFSSLQIAASLSESASWKLSKRYFCMESVLTKYLRAEHGETVQECVGAHVEDLRKLQS